MNNRKQQVQSFLDSITSKEMQDYIEDKKLNRELLRKFKIIKESRPTSHIQRLAEEINNRNYDVNNSFYKLGNAYIIAFILNCFYDDKYKINDIKHYLKWFVDGDEELKGFVYDIMKDF